MERTLVPGTGIATFLLPMAPPASARGVAILALATVRAIAILMRLRPRVVFGTGGYVSVPAGIAAWLLRIPLVLYLPDVVPGKAVRLLVPLARSIAVSSEDSLAYLPAEKTVITGYPVRETFHHLNRDTARRAFDLPPDGNVIVVSGGSKGSRSVNQALALHLPAILARCHVLHVCGEQRLPEAENEAEKLSAELRHRYHLFPYLHGREMADALAAADLAVCRSGASVFGELPAAGVPAVLVPLPIPSVHQRENALYLERRGATVILDDAALPERLGPVVLELLADPVRLDAMKTAVRSLARADAAERIAALVEAQL